MTLSTSTSQGMPLDLLSRSVAQLDLRTLVSLPSDGDCQMAYSLKKEEWGDGRARLDDKRKAVYLKAAKSTHGNLSVARIVTTRKIQKLRAVCNDHKVWWPCYYLRTVLRCPSDLVSEHSLACHCWKSRLHLAGRNLTGSSGNQSFGSSHSWKR